MGESGKSINKATTLLAERRKYEAWLAALDARRASTPERVFARVRADYESRLEAVVAELAGNADALDVQLADLTDRAKSLQASAQAIEDERVEAELRAHVGELDPAAWEAKAKEAEERIAAIVAERMSVEEELASVRELLTAAREPTPAASAAAVAPPPPGDPQPAAPGPAVQQAPEQPMTSDLRGTEEAAAGGDAPLVSEAPPAVPANFDELAFLRDIAGAEQGDAPAAAAPVPAAPEPADPTASAPEADLPADHPQRERPLNDALGLILPNDTPAIAPRRASTETPMAANVPGNSPIVLKPEVGRQGKTLKCTDCGSLNYPTEWYCERCGAELSAL